MRSESVLRRTLHHPIVYALAFVLGFATSNKPDFWISVGYGLLAVPVVWFVTGLIP